MTPHARGRLEREGDTTVPAERVKKISDINESGIRRTIANLFKKNS